MASTVQEILPVGKLFFRESFDKVELLDIIDKEWSEDDGPKLRCLFQLSES